MKDIFGNELNIGDYVYYGVLSRKFIGHRITRIDHDDEPLKILCQGRAKQADGTYRHGWVPMDRSRASAAPMLRIAPQDVPQEIREQFEGQGA